MKYVVEVRDTFTESIDEVFNYHESRNPGEGTDVLEVVWDKNRSLGTQSKNVSGSLLGLDQNYTW